MRTRAWFSVRRRRRSPRYDVGAVALVIVVLAVAAAGVYLLALGAVAFLAWLLRVATRRISDRIAEPPPPPLQPSPATAAPYLPVLAVDLPARVPAEWRIEHGSHLQARIDPGERVRSQTFTFLAVPSAAVTYSVLGEQHVVGLEGLRMLAPATTAVAAEPFLRRCRMLGRVKLALAALPVAATAIYAARGEYFTSGRAAGLVAGVVVATLATAALAYAALWNTTLGRRRARTWAAATIAPVALATLLAGLAEPRIARARELVAASQLDAAAAELRALDLPAADDAWADLHLRRSLAATTCSDATAQLRDIRPELPQRAQAQVHADDLAIAEAEAALRAQNADVASAALTCSSEAGRATAAVRMLRARIADLQTRRCNRDQGLDMRARPLRVCQ